MQYEYYFEGIEAKDLQDLIKRVNGSDIGITAVGASSSSAKVVSIAFEKELTKDQKQKLESFFGADRAESRYLKLDSYNETTKSVNTLEIN